MHHSVIKKTALLLVLLAGMQTIAYTQVVKSRGKRNFPTRNMPFYDRKLFHFGINLGVVMSRFAVRPIGDLRALLPDTVYSVNPVGQPGFSMGIESNLHIHKNFDFRFTPTLSLVSRALEYERPNDVDRLIIESTILDFPLYFKFKTNRLTNFRAYIIGGAKYSFDMSSKIGADDAGEYPVKIKPHDFSVEMGAGVEFYLPYFKFSMQVKASWGFVDLLFREDNPYNRAIEHLYSRSLFFSITFE